MATNAQYLASLVNSSGNIVIPVANGGIVFNNTNTTASPTSTTQNDYETGTWTPVSTGGSGVTFSSVNTSYTKVGRLVYIMCDVTFSSNSSNASAQISGLPFTVLTSMFSGATLAYYNGSNTNPFNSTYLVYNNTNYIDIRLVDDTGGNRTYAQLSGQRIILTATYQASF